MVGFALSVIFSKLPTKTVVVATAVLDDPPLVKRVTLGLAEARPVLGQLLGIFKVRLCVAGAAVVVGLLVEVLVEVVVVLFVTGAAVVVVLLVEVVVEVVVGHAFESDVFLE